MSYTDDFFNAMNSGGLHLRNRKLKYDYSNLVANKDIAPVRTVTQQKTVTPKEDDSKLDFFKESEGNVWQAILGTLGDAGLSAVKGVARVGEGLGDLVSYGIAGVADLIGQDEWADERRAEIQESLVDQLTEGATEYLDRYSVFGRTSDSIMEGVGQIGAIIATGGIGSAAGLGSVGTTALTTGTIGLSGVGSGMSDAYQGGATDLEALRYGINAGAAEAVSELIFGGLGKGINALGFSKGLSSADDILAKAASKGFKHQITKNIVEFGIKSGAEGLEEVISGVAQAWGKHRTYMSDEDFLDILKDENLLEQFVAGAFTSGIAQGGGLISSTKSGRDFVTGFSKNEQAVIKREVENRIAEQEKNGKKLTIREKSAIEERVVKDMERGYISTDTIESVLGGESYNAYKNAVDSENALVEEEQSLTKEFDAINKKMWRDMTGEEMDRREELKTLLPELRAKIKANKSGENRNQLKSKLSQEVFNMVKGDRLVESYNEKVRATQDFKADFAKFKGTKHEEAARKTLENAIKAGANNTNAVHDIVDLAAHISAKSGKVFEFKSNEDIKNDFIARQTKLIAEFEALENPTDEQVKYLAEMKDQLEKVKSGKVIVNGDITGDGIVLNIDSDKPLNRITGHEITHSLEQAKAYNELRDTLFAYAKSKGVDIDAKLAELNRKYAGVKDANPESELVADLVGDYLFTDYDYVQSLATGNRNLAQRIYDEVKHLYKMATAGSKEARQLEQVKYNFEKAFREAEQNRATAKKTNVQTDEVTNADVEEFSDANTSYSIREAEPPKETGVAYKVFFVKDGKLYPPMVANPEGADTPMGVWLDADVGQSAPPSKTGRAQVKAGGKGTQGGGGSLAFRPGWHLGDLPRASQFDRVNPETGKKELFPENFVWAEVEYAKDVDYQEEAMSYGYTENGKFRHAYAGLPRLPENGYYRYRTNPKPDTVPWIITGSMKVNRLLSDAEVNKILEENGVAPVHRQGGDVELDKFGFGEVFRDAEQAQKNTADSGVKYSLYEFAQDGRRYVEIDQDQSRFDGHSVDDYPRIAKDIINEKFNGKVIGIDNKMFVNGAGRDEFANPSKHIPDDIYEAKMRTAGELDNLLDAGTNFRNAPDGADGHFHNDVIGGFDYFDTLFKIGNRYFEAVINIKNVAKGKLFKDVTKIKDVTQDIMNSYGSNPKFQFLRTSSADIVRNDSEKVNPKFSITDEVKYSLTNDTTYMDKAITKNNSSFLVDNNVLAEAKAVRERIASKMNEIKGKGLVGLPEDIEGNTYIANSSYDGTEENTTICPRSLASEAFVDAVSEYLGRPLSVEEQIYISQDLQGRRLTPECTYCYVATDRKAYRAFLGDYIKQRDSVIQKLKDNPNADVSKSGELYNDFLNGRKDTKQMYDRFKMWVNAYKNGKPMIEASHLANINKLMGDINSEFGAELKPQIVDAMKYAQSASWAKKRIGYVAYNGHILNWKQDRIDKLNSHYGLRMYSFSDFHPAFVLENMQMITDASVRGLKMLGYTKDIDFVEIFAPSGMNINVSTFGFESGGNVFENNIIGAEWEKAKALREQYPNVGVTFVATNDNLVNWALEQDWIDVVIPYHLVRTGAEVAKAFNYTNYTSESSDTKDVGWAKGTDKKYIAPTEHNNDMATYLEALSKNHLKPRFERFIDNPNYMKLVNECRQPASESKPVQPVFNEDAAMSALAKLEANGYYQPIGGSIERMYEIAGEVAEAMMKDLAPTRDYSLSQQGEDIAPTGNYNVYGKDIALETAPVVETAPVSETVAPVGTQVTEEDEAPVDEATKRKEVESVVGNRDGFVSKKAMSLYEEVKGMKKGVRVSNELSYLLDTLDLSEEAKSASYNSLRTALLNIRDNPNQVVNPNSAIESRAREMIGREYDSMVDDFANAQGVTESIYKKMQGLHTELENDRKLREQSIVDFDSEIARLQEVYDSKKNQNTKLANDLLRRIERIKRLKSQVDADYGKRIETLEARLEKMSQPGYKTAMQRKQKQSEYTSLMEKLVGDTSTWVDKKLGISYKVNTLRRNLRDIVRDANGKQDIAKADAIYDELQGKYNHNEAELKRESMRIKKVFQELKLNHKEDIYAHMLGEFRHNPDSKLTEDDVKKFYEKHKGKIDTAKVDKAIEESRKVFDELIVRVNERLREQGMKEIPYRQGYFPHFTNPKQNWFHKWFNWKPVDSEIPTSIAGLTEEFNPERSWQSFNKERKGDTTDYSLEQGLDSYIHGALDWIYHIEDIQKRRALENHIRYVHSDEGIKKRIEEIRNNETYDADEAQALIDAVYAEAKNPLNNFVTDLRAGTNTLANKKSSMDRKTEELTNRKIYSVMTNLNNRINANMVVGSFSSALTNFIPITQSWMEVSPVYSLKGMRDTIISTIRDDGIVNKSDFLTNRLMNEEKLHQTGWDKVSDKAAVMMEAIDSFSSQTVWRSKYLQNISEGMSEAEAIKNADQFAENVIAGRSRGNQPTIFDAKNPLTKIFTAFQLEVNNQYGYMFKDAPQDSKNKTRLIKGYATAFLGAYAYNALYSSLVGRDAAFDPISILEDLFGDLFGDDEEEPDEILLNLADNILEEVPFVGGLVGGGRVPLSSALPYNGDYKTFITDLANGELSTKEMLKPLYYLVLPVGGGQIKKTNEGLGMFSDDHPVSGSYTESGNLRFPVEKTPGNVLQAAMFGQYASKNARDYFDNGRSPLKEKQIQEYMDVDIPIRDYWDYREGLAKQEKLEEKLDYISGLDLPVAKKNILANNVSGRKDPINMGSYGDFASLDEYDFATNNPGKYAVSKVVGDYGTYSKYYADINDLTADKDENGKSITGSRKEKVFDYINSLPIDYGQKCILFKSQYKADDSMNRDIIEYLNSREDISTEEVVTILTELGFTVKGNNVYWD